MINPKVQFEARGIPKRYIEDQVIKAALAALPACMAEEGEMGSVADAIDAAFEIAHAFVRASGFVLEEDAPAESKPHRWPCHLPDCHGSLKAVPERGVYRCSECGGEVSDAVIMLARYYGKRS